MRVPTDQVRHACNKMARLKKFSEQFSEQFSELLRKFYLGAESYPPPTIINRKMESKSTIEAVLCILPALSSSVERAVNECFTQSERLYRMSPRANGWMFSHGSALQASLDAIDGAVSKMHQAGDNRSADLQSALHKELLTLHEEVHSLCNLESDRDHLHEELSNKLVALTEELVTAVHRDLLPLAKLFGCADMKQCADTHAEKKVVADRERRAEEKRREALRRRHRVRMQELYELFSENDSDTEINAVVEFVKTRKRSREPVPVTTSEPVGTNEPVTKSEPV